MCRSLIKDKNYVFGVELDKKGLSKRVCQIFAAQVGVEAGSEGSLVQRIGQYLSETNLKSIPLRCMCCLTPMICGFMLFLQGISAFQHLRYGSAGEDFDLN